MYTGYEKFLLSKEEKEVDNSTAQGEAHNSLPAP